MIEELPDFKGCVVKKSTHYYKEMVDGVIGALCLILWCTVGALIAVEVFILCQGSFFNTVISVCIVGWLSVVCISAYEACDKRSVKNYLKHVTRYVCETVILISSVFIIVICGVGVPVTFVTMVLVIVMHFTNNGLYALISTLVSLGAIAPISLAFYECFKITDWVINCYSEVNRMMQLWADA